MFRQTESKTKIKIKTSDLLGARIAYAYFFFYGFLQLEYHQVYYVITPTRGGQGINIYIFNSC